MTKLLKILLAAITVIAAPFVVWHLCDNPEQCKIEPLVGEWHSTGTDNIRLTIRSGNDGYLITVRRTNNLHTGRTYRLRYRFCIHYTDSAGRRTDLFYTPSADVLLLMPGGKTFTRITES